MAKSEWNSNISSMTLEMLEFLRPQELCLAVEGLSCSRMDWLGIYHDVPPRGCNSWVILSNGKIRYSVQIDSWNYSDSYILVPSSYPVMLGTCADGIAVYCADHKQYYIDEWRLYTDESTNYSYKIPTYQEMMSRI